jgi:hypothetical protein
VLDGVFPQHAAPGAGAHTDAATLTELRTAGLDNAARYPLSWTVR